MFLEKLGADARVAGLFRPHAGEGIELGRVSFASHEQYRIYLENGECDGAGTGRLRWSDDLPAVGDWVVAQRVDPHLALIEAVLPRRTKFSRRASGRDVAEQVLAANIDLAVIVAGLDGDFNLRRIERYLVLVREGGAGPVIVLNKADLCNSVQDNIDAVSRIAGGAPVLALSARTNVEPLANIIDSRTLALFGSSGAGKSTITNGLLRETRQPIGPVRLDDSRGRHTTTSRMLMPLPAGGAIIDNPGLRELQLWASEDSLNQTFDEISSLAEGCKFPDCGHTVEPGCAVREALENGTIEPLRWQGYCKLQKELRYQLLQQDVHARNAERKRWKAIEKALRNNPKHRR